MKETAKTLIYAAIMGLICSMLLSGARIATQPRVDANRKAERSRNILDVLGVSYDRDASARELEEIFANEVSQEEINGLAAYRYPKTGAAERIAVPVAGPGLWAPIKGFLALDPELEKILAVTFYEQEETPGLGGEIAGEDFRSRFAGTSVRSGAGEVRVEVVRPGTASAPNQVDGISGATMTCNKVQAMLNATLSQLIPAAGEGRAGAAQGSGEASSGGGLSRAVSGEEADHGE